MLTPESDTHGPEAPEARVTGGRARIGRFFLISLISSLLLVPREPGRMARADGPASQPTVALPANSPIRTWFKRLADPDPRIRDQAEVDLMGMSASDLPVFRQLIEASEPLAPAQAVVLQDIVEQVYLTAEKYTTFDGETDASGTEGPYFLGVYWPGQDNNARLGVQIHQRLLGFPSFRYLHDGDMILSVTTNPSTPDSLEMPTNIQGDLSAALKRVPQSQNVVLLVLRDGEEIHIPIRLAPRPFECSQENIASTGAFRAARARRAEDYWNENFEPLVDREVVVDAD